MSAGTTRLQLAHVSPCAPLNLNLVAGSLNLLLDTKSSCLSMVGLSGAESTVVDAAEKLVGREKPVSVLCRLGGLDSWLGWPDS
jgi:hypothetical protein